MLLSVLIILLVPYAVLFLLWVLGIEKVKQQIKNKEQYGVSVIIPFRNEKANFPSIVNALMAQDYPSNRFSVTFINDHSEDKGEAALESLIQNDGRFSLIHLTEESGKKTALRKGIKQAKHDIVITTDADCTFEPNWLSEMVSSFTPKEDHLLTAPVIYMHQKGIISSLLQLEQAALMAVTAGSIGSGIGFMCNGANLMFSKELYLAFNDADLKTEIASGDDVFLLHSVKRKFGNKAKLKYCFSKAASVSTQMPDTFRSGIHQRVRWAKKSNRYTDLSSLIHGLSILFANASIGLAFLFFLLGSINLQGFLLLFGLKAIFDILLVSRVNSIFDLKWLLPKSILLSIIYPFYALLIAILSLFMKPNWKGRKV